MSGRKSRFFLIRLSERLAPLERPKRPAAGSRRSVAPGSGGRAVVCWRPASSNDGRRVVRGFRWLFRWPRVASRAARQPDGQTGARAADSSARPARLGTAATDGPAVPASRPSSRAASWGSSASISSAAAAASAARGAAFRARARSPLSSAPLRLRNSRIIVRLCALRRTRDSRAQRRRRARHRRASINQAAARCSAGECVMRPTAGAASGGGAAASGHCCCARRPKQRAAASGSHDVAETIWPAEAGAALALAAAGAAVERRRSARRGAAQSWARGPRARVAQSGASHERLCASRRLCRGSRGTRAPAAPPPPPRREESCVCVRERHSRANT